jgi:LmbE family N-acetylglucosaminyl deacetylase
MATVVSFHAHPDDESIQTGGTLAKLAAQGHRTVLVFATKGEEGEVADGFLDDGEALWQRREKEVAASAAVIGVQRVEFLGYEDSGMMGTPENDRPESFWQADVDEAAERLATILRDEQADVLTAYDSDGGYGHPDHIQVHRVGLRAAELAGTPRFFEATMNRDHLRRLFEAQRERAEADRDIDPDNVPDVGESSSFGRPESVITTSVDVSDFVAQKRQSMRVHASQIGDDHFFATMPDEIFAISFGQEWFIRHGVPEGHRDDDLLAGLV